MTAASAAIMAGCCPGSGQQVPMPGPLLDIAGYVALAGSVLAAVSQLTVDDKALQALNEKKNQTNE